MPLLLYTIYFKNREVLQKMKQYIYKNKHSLETQFLKNAKNSNKKFYEM